MVLSCILLVTSLQARVLHIPSQYPTIQSGIDAASAGDTVLADDGIYYEQLIFFGHSAITVGSNFILDADESHIKNTILDGSQVVGGNNRSIVYFGEGNDTTTVLSGFTIRGGNGTWSNYFDGEFYGGGAIFIKGGGAKITHNIITGNQIHEADFGGNGNLVCGGGIYSAEEPEEYWTVISDNEISYNTIKGSRYKVYGGGICLSNNARVIKNVIRGNSCHGFGTDQELDGGGIRAIQYYFTKEIFLEGNIIDSNLVVVPENSWSLGAGVAIFNQHATIINNEITRNKIEIQYPGGGGSGVGLDLSGSASRSLVHGNLFEGNEGILDFSSPYPGIYGGGMKLWGLPGNPVAEVSNNKFSANKADRGGAIEIQYIDVDFYNNLFMNNSALMMGGAMFFQWDSPPDSNHLALIANNTFYKNFAEHGGAIGSNGVSPLIMNSIFYQDSSSTGTNEFYVFGNGGNLEVFNSDIDTIEAGNASPGNVLWDESVLHEDPQFADLETLHLEHWSPCVDAGASSVTCSHGDVFYAPPDDMDGESRPVGNGYDMGAYDTDSWPLGAPHMARVEVRISNLPNPVVSTTKFRYDLSESGNAVIRVYNQMGMLVAMPVNQYDMGGMHEKTWDASGLPGGIYYYTLSAGNRIASGKMIKL